MDAKNLFLSIIVIGGILTAWIFYTIFHNWKRDMNAPEKTVKATAIDKRSSVPVRDYNSIRSQTTRYYITFRTETGEIIELLVSQTNYKAILADAEGYLTYKGSRIVDFKRIEA